MLQVGDLIQLLENSNLGATSWFALTLMEERLQEDIEICLGFFFLRWSDEF
jgi:hypothetical protein